MTEDKPVAMGIVVAWVLVVLLAGALSAISETAGIMEGPAVGIAMAGGFGLAAASAWAVWDLLHAQPILVRRLMAIGAMAGAIWGVGTLTRVLYFMLG